MRGGQRRVMEPADRLLVQVERFPGSGTFEVDGRLGVEAIRQRPVGRESTARVAVRLDDSFDGEEARRRYHPDRRVLITTGEGDEAARAVLFDGYPPVQSCGWDGRFGRDREWYAFDAEDVLARLSRRAAGQVHGRRVRSLEIEAGLAADPARFASASAVVTALPCVFNPDGLGNKATTPLVVSDSAGVARRVAVFAWDGGGEQWTCGEALRYLLWHHLPKEARGLIDELWAVTAAAAGEVAVAGDGLSAMLMREPVSLACEATTLVEALALWSEASRVRLSLESELVVGRVRSRLRAWSATSGPMKRLLLARGGRREDGSRYFEPAAGSAESTLLENNTHRGEAAWDHRASPGDVVVLGGVKRYEVTLPLWPGWVVTDLLDDVPPALRGYAKALALTPAQVEGVGGAAQQYAWFQRYHRQGSLFRLDPNVARRWVLNEDGAFAGSLYDRYAPFDAYGRFDFTQVVGAEARGWMARPRRLLAPLSSAGGAGQARVEVSFDGGATWQQPAGGVRILADRAGIYFDCENPTEIAPAGVDPASLNMWYALVDQVFRVRVTAVVEGDDRLIGRWLGPTDDRQQRDVAVVSSRTGFAYARGSAGGTGSDAAAERDDSAAIAAEAARLGAERGAVRVVSVPAIPWVETGYVLGDRIAELCGRQLRLSMGAGTAGPWPVVMERGFVLREGRYETELEVAGMKSEEI